MPDAHKAGRIKRHEVKVIYNSSQRKPKVRHKDTAGRQKKSCILKF